MRQPFVDTSVLLHAVGGEHPLRQPSRDMIRKALKGGGVHVGAESVQEFLFHRMRVVDRSVAVRDTQGLLEWATVLPFDREIAVRACQLVAEGSIGGRDAILAATALCAGFDTLVTHDRRFGAVAGLCIISAADWLAQN